MANKTWSRVGGSPLASTPGNWSGGTLPQNGDNLIFDVTSSLACTWDLTRTLANWNMNAGFTGAISMDTSHDVNLTGIFTINAGTFNKNPAQVFNAAGGFSQGGGTFNNSGTMYALVSMSLLGGAFNGGPKPSTVNSDGVTINGGTVTGPNGDWNVAGTWLKLSGTYAHNTGTVNFTGSTHGVANGGSLFYNTTIQKTGTANMAVSVGQVLPMIGLGPYPISMGSGTVTVSGEISAAADISLSGAGGFLTFAAGSVLSGAITKITANGTGVLIDPAATIPAALNITFSPFSGDVFFDGGGKTFGTIERTGTGSGKVSSVQHGWTAALFRDNLATAVAHALEFAAGLVFSAKWRIRGHAGALLTLQSDTPGLQFFMTGTAGDDIESDYLVVTDSFAGPGIVGYAGTHSSSGGRNTNWYFNAAPHPGRILLDWRHDAQGMSACAPPRIHAVAGQRLELLVTYENLIRGLFPVAYESPAIAPDSGWNLRWIGKRAVDDDDAAALFDVTGEIIESAVGTLAVPAALIPDEADQMYTELILTQVSSTENVSARVPLWLTLSRAGVI